MFRLKKITNERMVSDASSHICSSLLSGDYSDSQIAEILNNVNSRSLNYLESRREKLNFKLQENIQAIKSITND